MIGFNNILLILRLLYVISDIQAGSSNSKKSYKSYDTSEEFVKDLEELRKKPKQITDLEYITIVDRLLRSNTETIFEQTKESAIVSNFRSECLKNVQLVYVEKEYDLIFSSRQENSAEPMEGLVARVRRENIKSAMHFLKRVENVYLTIIIFIPPGIQLFFFSSEWNFDFITSLCVEYCNNRGALKLLSFEQAIPDSILRKLGELKILKLVNMLVANTSLEKVSNNLQLENVSCIRCCFYHTKTDVNQSQSPPLRIKFSESCKTICFNKCSGDLVEKNLAETYQSYYSQVTIDVGECANLYKLDIASDTYICVLRGENCLRWLKEFSLHTMCDEIMSRCSFRLSAQLAYLSISAIEKGTKAIEPFLTIIDRSKLQHLVIINPWCGDDSEILNIFKLKFDTLEILEIETGSLEINGFDGEVNMKKLKSLTIRCKNIKNEFAKILNQLESLTDLYMDFLFGNIGVYKDFLEQLGLKESLKYLFISRLVPVGNLKNILKSFKSLERFKVEGRFSNRLDKQNMENESNGYSNLPHGLSSEHLISQTAACPLVKTLILSAYVWTYRNLLDLLNQKWILENFPNVEKLEIHNSTEMKNFIPDQQEQAFDTDQQEQAFDIDTPPEIKRIDSLTDDAFSKFRSLQTIVFVGNNDDLYKKFCDELYWVYLGSGKKILKRLENSGGYNCMKFIFEIHR